MWPSAAGLGDWIAGEESLAPGATAQPDCRLAALLAAN